MSGQKVFSHPSPPPFFSPSLHPFFLPHPLSLSFLVPVDLICFDLGRTLFVFFSFTLLLKDKAKTRRTGLAVLPSVEERSLLFLCGKTN